MSPDKRLKTTALALVLTATTVLAQTPYDEGQKALREQNWNSAAEHFEQSIEHGEGNADAAMYWRALALYKAGKYREAERQVRSLERNYPDSRWLKEARVLQMEHEGSETALAETAQGEVLDDDLRVFALAQLMQRNPERALPLLLELMNTTPSDSVRRNAFFMLGMSDDPGAQQAIAQFARDSRDPELQVEAIHMLGMASNPESMELLSSLYAETTDREVKEAVIQAYTVGDETRALVQLLEKEQDPELEIAILHALGVTGDTSELQRLYPTLSSTQSKVAAIEAMALAGDSQILRQVLNNETDPELRAAAIYGIAMEDGSDSAALLEQVYSQARTTEEKQAVLEALTLMDEGHALALAIVQTETDLELRRQAIYTLGAMEATDDLAGLYASIDTVELRRAILESLSIADDTDGLITLLQSETDPELRSAAIQVLAISEAPETAEFLLSLYPDASQQEKQAIIQAMMIMEDAPGLIGLLNSETNPNLKRQMVQLLATMDSEETEDYLFDLLENEQ